MEWGSIIVQVILEAVGVTVGIVAGTWITLRSSRLASEELRREAGELRHYIDVLAGFLVLYHFSHFHMIQNDTSGYPEQSGQEPWDPEVFIHEGSRRKLREIGSVFLLSCLEPRRAHYAAMDLYQLLEGC